MAPSNAKHAPLTLTRPSYDPKALLAPKAAGKRTNDANRKEPANPYTAANTSSLLSNPSNTNPIPSNEGRHEEQGMGSMIERMHNVEKREDHPIKRQKKDHGKEDTDEDLTNEKKKIASGSIGGSGDMGDYLKEERKKGQSADPHHIVDLTADDDESSDSVMVTADTSNTEVCLGRIENARVNAHRVPTPKSSGAFQGIRTHWPPIRVTLHRRPGPTSVIAVADPTEKDFGTIDQRVAVALAPLMDGKNTTKIRIQARLDGRAKKPFDYPGQQVSDHYQITINLYAPRKFVPGLGKWLSQKQIWLRDPLGADYGVPIFNPHAPKDHTPTQKVLLAKRSTDVGSNITVRSQEEVRQDVFKIFDTLQETTDLPEVLTPEDIVTPLLSHQKQALYFMRKRERLPVTIAEGSDRSNQIQDGEGSIWKKNVRGDGRIRWMNVITGHEVRQEPAPALGGILADVMGLGKTLNILSLVVGSTTEANTWAGQAAEEPEYEDDPTLKFNSKATLLVCPLSTIVNWEEQIKTHVKSKALTYCIYQGPNRTNDAYKLRNYDMVITTYGTVATDINRKSRNRPNSPLFEVNWFRVVLDEAHTIRKQTTVQSKAACMLSASRRWCVSGTPVQNRLDDLGALIKFLRIKPFDEPGNFASYISTPLRTGNSEAIPKLRLLVDSITLRRLKDKLDLPDRKELIVTLQMSDEERKLYDMFARDTYKTFEAMGGQKKALGGKSYAHVLRAIGRLRMLCVHGSDMLSDDDWERIKGFDAANAIDLEDEDDDRPDRTSGQAFEMYRIMKDSNVHFCARCNNWITPAEENEDSDYEPEDETQNENDDVIGHLTPCNQLICPKCIDKFRKELKSQAGPDNYATCPICDNYIRVTFFPLKQSEILEDERAQEAIRKSSFAKNLSRYTGPSTKVKALLSELNDSQQWSDDHPDERPRKSVVFSEWVHLLDLMQVAFTSTTIKFARLDGRMSFSKRTSAINSFMTSPDINVIIVSLKAGGLGLNLTAASRVYVMEPNFNPAAEAQAVERVHRLGQTRDVVIKKFIMESSIEEKVLILQEKKLSLAEFSVERDSLKKMSKDGAARQKLEDLKTLLR